MGDLQLVNRLHEPNHTLNAVPKLRACTPVGACRWARRRRDPMDGLWWRARCPYLSDRGYGLPARRVTAPRNDVQMIEYPNSALPVTI